MKMWLLVKLNYVYISKVPAYWWKLGLIKMSKDSLNRNEWVATGYKKEFFKIFIEIHKKIGQWVASYQGITKLQRNGWVATGYKKDFFKIFIENHRKWVGGFTLIRVLLNYRKMGGLPLVK